MLSAKQGGNGYNLKVFGTTRQGFEPQPFDTVEKLLPLDSFIQINQLIMITLHKLSNVLLHLSSFLLIVCFFHLVLQINKTNLVP